MHTQKQVSTLRSLKGREVIYFDIRPNGRFEFTGEAFIARLLEVDVKKHTAKIEYKMQWGETRTEWVDIEWITTVRQFREEMKLLKKKLRVDRNRRKHEKKSELHKPKKEGSTIHKVVRAKTGRCRVWNRQRIQADN
ncbi:MAG: hypothetical protein J0L60_06755 [Ignavibacteria bacterium]|nr:hypothetical protein [Ignavibacteria bacterium]